MLYQVSYAREAFIAVQTLIRVNSRMDYGMRDQTLAIGELFVANVAFEGLFLGVLEGQRDLLADAIF